MDIKNLRVAAKMSQSSFAKYFRVPVSTLQQWEQGRRIPPDYVVYMMERILKLEKGINIDE